MPTSPEPWALKPDSLWRLGGVGPGHKSPMPWNLETRAQESYVYGALESQAWEPWAKCADPRLPGVKRRVRHLAVPLPLSPSPGVQNAV